MLKLLVIKPNEGLQVIEPNQRFQLTPESINAGGWIRTARISWRDLAIYTASCNCKQQQNGAVLA